MKKTILILAVGALGLTAVNAQQQQPTTQEQMKITHQLTDEVKIGDLPEGLVDKIDEIIEDGETQLVHIEEAGEADNYEITFRKEDRAWKQKYDKDGNSEGDEMEIDTEPRTTDRDKDVRPRVREGQERDN